MQSRCTFQRFVASILCMLMVLISFPTSVMSESVSEQAEGINVEVILDSPVVASHIEEAVLTEPSVTEPPIFDTSSIEEALISGEEPTSRSHEQTSSDPEPSSEMNFEEDSVSVTSGPAELVEDNSEETQTTDCSENDGYGVAADEEKNSGAGQNPNLSLQEAIETYGYVYVATKGMINVYSSPALKLDTLIYTTANAVNYLLATRYTNHSTVVVWFLDQSGQIVNGFVDASILDDHYLLDDDLESVNYRPSSKGNTAIGQMKLFFVESLPTKEEPTSSPEANFSEEDTNADLPFQINDQTASAATEASVKEENTKISESENGTDTKDITESNLSEIGLLSSDSESVSSLIEIVPDAEETELLNSLPIEETSQLQDEYFSAGSYIYVTTKTRVFSCVDSTAAENYYSNEYIGHFVKDATVQILSVETTDYGNVWYKVRFLYGDVNPNGRLKWTAYGTAWILSNEVSGVSADTCTLTDYAYTDEFLRMIRSNSTMLKASTMNGFTLRTRGGSIGNFREGQSGLHGSSGRDSDYPQIAQSASYGTIYATPHFLSGQSVYCLEHTLSGPGEGDGSYQATPTGPYTLASIESYVNNSAYGGYSGVRFSEKTMHAVGWVLRHTYPFMVLDRSDEHNDDWTRVAGQFAIREVIKQLEGSRYVRSYWNMSSFYSFSGGAPGVYLTYAKWLASNAIDHAKVTGKITASDQSLVFSDNTYIGTVTLKTDADLIRISKSAGTISGNTGGSDSSYYYIKSGDTISISSNESNFSINMESISSSSEEANFLVAVSSAAIQKLIVPLRGSPYRLNSGRISFELSLGAVVVTKKSSDGIPLMGTEFELLDSSGTVLSTVSTLWDGRALFSGIQPGTYIVREKTPTQGYQLSTESKTITVSAGLTSEVDFINYPIAGRIRIIKTDQLTGNPLPGAVFTITRLSSTNEDEEVTDIITTNIEGLAETGPLAWGQYRITETKVPEGYINSNYTSTVWIK